ncbi:hypothetical protein LTR17_004161 [Elasticomyces elasticus]|nr:hypothetical protein LTR17_004161 [Elasticomyces elasticus]
MAMRTQCAYYSRVAQIPMLKTAPASHFRQQSGTLPRLSAAGRLRVTQLWYIRLLLDAGADPNATSNISEHLGSLATACFTHLQCTEILVTLLEAGADINASNLVVNALQVAACFNTAAVDTLLQWGADVNVPGSNRTRKWLSNIPRYVNYKNREDVSFGVKRLFGEEGNFGTALQIASVVGHVDAMRLLIAEGADVNAPGVFTALGVALVAGQKEVVQVLEQAGARITEMEARKVKGCMLN